MKKPLQTKEHKKDLNEWKKYYAPEWTNLIFLNI